MADDELYGFDAVGAERIVDAVRAIEQLPVRSIPQHRQIVGSGGRNLMLGKLDADCAAGGSATLSIWDGDADTGDDEEVTNWFSSTVTSGTKVMAAWIARAQKWYIVSADCP